MKPASACITINPRSGATFDPDEVNPITQATSADQAGWVANPGAIAAVNPGTGTVLGPAAGDPPVLPHPAAPTAMVAATAHIPRRARSRMPNLSIPVHAPRQVPVPAATAHSQAGRP